MVKRDLERELGSITSEEVIHKRQSTQKIDTRELTVLFSDIVGITAYFDRHGDLAGAKRINTHNQLLFPIVSSFSGTVIKTIGDAILACFDTPTEGVQAAVAMQRELDARNRTRQPDDRIHIRIGLNCGGLVVENRDVFGDVVNVASRVCGKAVGDQILITRPVADAVRSGPVRVSFHSLEILKGKEESIQLFDVEWSGPTVERQLPESPPDLADELEDGSTVVEHEPTQTTCTNCGKAVAAYARFCPACGGALASDLKTQVVDPFIGRELDGKFLINQLIGEGGMGRVYKATQLSLGKPVCVKVLRSDRPRDVVQARRFRREAYAASRLIHPNAILVQDFGQAREDGSLYLVMEYVPGRSLGQVISKEWPLGERRTVHIMGQVLSALSAAHQAGMVHRDLKPENIMVTDPGGSRDFVKVLDFGLAKLREGEASDPSITQAGIVCGTPEYMSPEQARGEELDPRSDLYSAGVILYQMVVGRVPFSAATPMGIITRHLTEAPIPPSRIGGVAVSPELERAILKAVSKNREDRQSSALGLKKELDNALVREASRQKESRGIFAPGVTWRVFKKRPPLYLWVSFGILLLLVAGVSLLLLASGDKGKVDFKAVNAQTDRSLELPLPEPPPPAMQVPAETVSAVVPDSMPNEKKPAPRTLSESEKLKRKVEAVEKDATQALVRLGVLPKDVREILLLKDHLSKLKARRRYKDALPVARRIRDAARRVRVDQKFVEQKLVRFNRLFERLNPGKTVSLEGVLERIMEAMERGNLKQANRLLNRGFRLIEKSKGK